MALVPPRVRMLYLLFAGFVLQLIGVWAIWRRGRPETLLLSVQQQQEAHARNER